MTPLKVPNVNRGDAETHWDRLGWPLGVVLGILFALLLTAPVALHEFRSDSLWAVCGILCYGLPTALFGGLLGLVMGGLLGIAVRYLRRSNKVDERILEAALDRREEIARPWSLGGSQNLPPPADAETTDITRDPEGKAPKP